MQRTAFSLVELAIVLVILGLLVGGLLAGQSLIRASELRSVGTDLEKVKTAIHAFQDKYFALPGDMTNATSFWGKDATNCNAQTGTAATPGTCNGDGDRKFGSTLSPEAFRAWQHLAFAGLWPGNWPGTASIAAGQTVAGDNPGTNLPAARYRRTIGNTALGYKLRSYGAGGNDRWNSNENGTALFISNALNACCGAPFLDGGGLPSIELWQLDMKIDDGMPGTGKMQVKYGYAGGVSTTLVASTAEYIKSETNTGPFYYDVGINW